MAWENTITFSLWVVDDLGKEEKDHMNKTSGSKQIVDIEINK
jgi:hypothetical protein